MAGMAAAITWVAQLKAVLYNGMRKLRAQCVNTIARLIKTTTRHPRYQRGGKLMVAETETVLSPYKRTWNSSAKMRPTIIMIIDCPIRRGLPKTEHGNDAPDKNDGRNKQYAIDLRRVCRRGLDFPSSERGWCDLFRFGRMALDVQSIGYMMVNQRSSGTPLQLDRMRHIGGK